MLFFFFWGGGGGGGGGIWLIFTIILVTPSYLLSVALIDEFANSVDPDEAAHYEQPLLVYAVCQLDSEFSV